MPDRVAAAQIGAQNRCKFILPTFFMFKKPGAERRKEQDTHAVTYTGQRLGLTDFQPGGHSKAVLS